MSNEEDLLFTDKIEGKSVFDIPSVPWPMNSTYINKAIDILYRYINTRLEKTDTHVRLIPADIYVVWFSKTLQNWKCLFSTTLPDGMYYELTYDGDRKVTYLDAYKKWENTEIPDETG